MSEEDGNPRLADYWSVGPCVEITQEIDSKGKKWWAWNDFNLRPAERDLQVTKDVLYLGKSIELLAEL